MRFTLNRVFHYGTERELTTGPFGNPGLYGKSREHDQNCGAEAPISKRRGGERAERDVREHGEEETSGAARHRHILA